MLDFQALIDNIPLTMAAHAPWSEQHRLDLLGILQAFNTVFRDFDSISVVMQHSALGQSTSAGPFSRPQSELPALMLLNAVWFKLNLLWLEGMLYCHVLNQALDNSYNRSELYRIGKRTLILQLISSL